jgi:hypothetical protein
LRQSKSNLPPQTHRDAKHEEKKPYNCAHCEESFAQKRKLYVHVQAVHTGKNEFACEQCDASYTEYRKHSDFIRELDLKKLFAQINKNIVN